MAAMSVADAANEVLRELPHISSAEATQYVTALRDMMHNWGDTFGGTDTLVEKVLKAAPQALPKGLALPVMHETLRRHLLTLVEVIIDEEDQFTMDWANFGWDELRASMAKAHKKVDAAEQRKKAAAAPQAATKSE